MSFDRALSFTLKEEGGYVNDPADSGGATNKGITQAAFNSYRKGLPFQSVKTISDEDVREIYLRNYWAASHCDALPDELATVVFDTAVNSGTPRAVKILQACLDIKTDGIFGGDTQRAVNAIKDLKAFTNKYLSERSAFYQRLVQVSPDKNKFLIGWLRRVENLREFIFT